jgi:hypothetical protein
MKIISREDFLKEMDGKQYVVSYDSGKKVYMQDFIMNYYTKLKISSFDKNSRYGVRFIDGNPLNCRKENLEVVELYDSTIYH